MKTVSDVSEDQLLTGFLPIIREHNRRAGHLLVGPGDDCAVLEMPAGRTVMTTDTQTENRDFRRTWANGYTTGGYEVGWKAATQNLADIAAMGATPVTLLVSLTLTPDTPVDWVTDFARGITDSCRAQGAETCSLAGGDLGAGTEISVTVTAVGTCPAPVLRSGAVAGDALVLAGAAGTAAAGFALLENGSGYRVTEALTACIRAQQRPRSPLTAGVTSAANLHAMMDVSDGLVRDAQRIACASGVSIDIDSLALAPWAEKVAEAASICAPSGQNPLELALHWVLTGGEDHGLLATCHPQQIPTGFTRIGTVTEATLDSAVTVDGTDYRAQGWDHFEATAG